MKPQLVIGLGNPLMGDDGIGCIVAERLANHPRLPENVEVICGGTDLLRHAGRIEGRSSVVVIDAVQDVGEPGNVVSLATDDAGLDERQQHVHQLSAVQCIRLLQMTTSATFLLLGISISAGRVHHGLSPELSGRMPMILGTILGKLGGPSADEHSKDAG
jgi:hydrogenase maturation protease